MLKKSILCETELLFLGMSSLDPWLSVTPPEDYLNFLCLYEENPDEIKGAIKKIIECKIESGVKNIHNFFLLGNNQKLKKDEFEKDFVKIKEDIKNYNIDFFNLGAINYDNITEAVVVKVVENSFKKLGGEVVGEKCCCSVF